jgi:DNA-directed RNA polymerase specialized sigma subunit
MSKGDSYGVENVSYQNIASLVNEDKKNCDARSFIEQRCVLADLLPVRERVMFRLYYEWNLSFKDIGLVFGILPENIARRLDRINQMLDNISRDVQRE